MRSKRIIFAQPRLLIPKTLPSSCDAVSSKARVVMPLANTAIYSIRCCDFDSEFITTDFGPSFVERRDMGRIIPHLDDDRKWTNEGPTKYLSVNYRLVPVIMQIKN